MRGHDDLQMAGSPPASAPFMSPLSSEANGSFVLPLGMLRRERLHAVEREDEAGNTSAARPRACRRCRRWRCARRAGTKSGAAFLRHLRSTKATMDCLALPSFQDGSGSAARAMVPRRSQRRASSSRDNRRRELVLHAAIHGLPPMRHAPHRRSDGCGPSTAQRSSAWRQCLPLPPLLQLLQHLVEREAAGLLPRRELDVGLQVLGHEGLRRHEHEGVLDAPPVVVARRHAGRSRRDRRAGRRASGTAA